ncbi:MAG: tRNA (guanosine(46)-N7)-methyltransferase TrmB [Lachnospiraceae bacterium]
MRLRNIKGADEAIANSPYCIQNPVEYKSNWDRCFHRHAPLHLEIGMGKGQFLMELARQNPQINFIGIERYASVLLRALQKMEEEPLDNLRFLCINAEYLPDYFAPEEVEKIYLNFSDPWPKDRHAKRRLTSRQFLQRYDQVLSSKGTIEFKTDNRGLFDFSLEEAKDCGWHIDACTYDLHNDPDLNEGNIQTEYEEKFSSKGNPIHKVILSRKKK